MKYMAIDYGLMRTGLAVSDPAGTMAFPRTTILMQGKDHYFGFLADFIATEKIESIVVGLPLYQDGSESETTRIVRNMTHRLKRRHTLPIYYMEEYLSSVEAELRLREAGKDFKSIRKKIDQTAAATILESFLSLSAHHRVLA